MPGKKSVELVEEIQSPKALIINGGEASSFLEKTLKERGCDTEKTSAGRPSDSAGKFDYIFLFDNHIAADKIYENNLKPGGRFILILTEEMSGSVGIPRPGQVPHFRIIKIGDPSLWSLPQLSDKILRAIFSSTGVTVDIRRKQAVSVVKKKEIQKAHDVIPSTCNKLSVNSAEGSRDSSHTPPAGGLVGMTKSHKTHRFTFRKIFLAVFFIFLGALLLTGGIIYGYSIKILKTYNLLEYHLKSGNLPGASSDFKAVAAETRTVQKLFNFSINILFPLKENADVKKTSDFLSASAITADKGEDFANSVSDILPKASGFGEGGANVSKDELEALEKKLTAFTVSLLDLKKATKEVTLPYFPNERLDVLLSSTIEKLISGYEILPVFNEVFFTDTPKVYLILFQNNMELRPTGGFIGSYGLLTIDRGQIADFKIEDVYTADGQLKGHVDPPPPIRKYLQQPHFFLRDSNFNPDFAASALQASWFLQKELGKDVDGVIGVNLIPAQKILQVIGGITLSDFPGEEISADNFFFKVHTFTQSNFFPGSTQKKDILTAVANGIFAKLNQKEKTNLLELMPVIKQALEEKNIIIYLDDEKLQKVIESHGWAGRMAKVECTEKKNNQSKKIADSASCTADYLSVIETNLGVNKANYFINKSTVIEKKINKSGEISTALTVSYENNDTSLVLKPQTYVNYLRFFVPAGSLLSGLTLNNAEIPAVEIDTDPYESDKISFGALIKIAPGNRAVVKLTYTHPRLLSSEVTNYQLYYQKQPGDKNSALIFSMTYPDALKLTPENFISNSQRNNEIYYTTDSSVDRVFALVKQ